MTALDRYDDVWEVGEVDFDTEPATAATIEEADRYGWVRCRIAAEMEELERVYDARIRELTERKEQVLATKAQRLAWLDRTLEGWTRAHHAETGAKSVRLPSVTVSLRKGRERVDPVADPPERDDRFVRVKRQWDLTAVKDGTNPGPVVEGYDAPPGFVAHHAVDQDGQVVEGVVRLLPTDRLFSVKAAE